MQGSLCQKKGFSYKQYIGVLRRRREAFGWTLLTDQKRFYAENYPRLVIERITMDEFILMMLKGEVL